MAYSDQQAMDDYRNLPAEDRPLVKNFAQTMEKHNLGKKVSHLYDQVDRETPNPPSPADSSLGLRRS